MLPIFQSRDISLALRPYFLPLSSAITVRNVTLWKECAIEGGINTLLRHYVTRVGRQAYVSRTISREHDDDVDDDNDNGVGGVRGRLCIYWHSTATINFFALPLFACYLKCRRIKIPLHLQHSLHFFCFWKVAASRFSRQIAHDKSTTTIIGASRRSSPLIVLMTYGPHKTGRD